MNKHIHIKKNKLLYIFTISLLLISGCENADGKSKDVQMTDLKVNIETETVLDNVINTESTETSDKAEENSIENIYMEVINEYKDACAENSEDWLANPETYLSKYPCVNEYILEMYHTPSHYDDYFESDEPYALFYMLYDIDDNGISELLLSRGHHEIQIFAIYTYDGENAVELDLIRPEDYGTYGIYTNNVIAAYCKNGVDYYKLAENGFSVEKIELTIDEIYNLSEYQFIASLEDWEYLGKDVAAVSDELESSEKWNASFIENIQTQIINHYTQQWKPDGEYRIFSNESIDDTDEMIFILRYAMSNKKSEEIIANGGTPSANILVTLIHVNKSTGEVYDEDAWTIDFD